MPDHLSELLRVYKGETGRYFSHGTFWSSHTYLILTYEKATKRYLNVELLRRDMNLYEAQWLAYVVPCRRFAAAFAGDRARLGVDVDRYSFIVSDLHRLLIAGLPAHCERFWTLPATGLYAQKFNVVAARRLCPGLHGNF